MRLREIALVAGLSGCLIPAHVPTTAELLSKCRAEGRAAFEAGATAPDANAVYERCKAREGVQ